VLFGGDTAMSDCFDDINGVDLAMLGIGGYDPYVAAHATPEQALEMAGRMRAQFLLPMHHSTFRLSHEPADEPIGRLLDAAGAWRGQIVVSCVGGQWSN
jgi:L-ascorbate metabolism protein UlaG (beta-lactamase superfamily)